MRGLQAFSLGSGETGGGLSLPIWIRYMQTALQGVPVTPITEPPPGVTRSGGDWAYEEYAGGRGINRIGVSTYGSSSGGEDAEAEQGESPSEAGGSVVPSAEADIFRSN